jgi:hypothetical protein
VGEALDLAGMVVMATYSNKSSKDVTALAIADLADGTVLNTLGEQTVTVSFSEDGITRTDSFTVTVTAESVAPTISGLAEMALAEGYAAASTAAYTLTGTGTVIVTAYSDTDKIAWNNASKTLSIAAGLVAGEYKITLTASNGTAPDATLEFTLTVTAIVQLATMTSIAVTTPPAKTDYTAGEALDLTGMVVTAYYSDGSSRAVTGYTADPADGAVLGIVGTQTVSVSYTEDGVTKTASTNVTVNAVVPPPVMLDGIAVTTPPTKTVYTAGVALDLTGMVVTATYSDGSAANVTGYTTSPANGASLNAVGTQTINISYAEDGVTKTASANVTVNPGSTGGVDPGDTNSGGTPYTPPDVEVITDDDPPLTVAYPKHIRYIFGYPDGRVGPEASLTRAEMCVILFRLLTAEDKNDELDARFPDVKEGAWYYQAVTYLAHIGIVSGYPDGEFKPDRHITRAEFAAIAAKLGELINVAGNDGNGGGNGKAFYPDIEGHWAQTLILGASGKGWLNGYPDGTFRPQSNLTRAEAVTIVNRMFARRVDKEDLPGWTPAYSDLPPAHWAYADIMEASVGHTFERADDGRELWIAQLPDDPTTAG